MQKSHNYIILQTLMARETGFNPRSSHTKDLKGKKKKKMVLDTSLLNIQYYKVHIKGNSGAIQGKE